MPRSRPTARVPADTLAVLRRATRGYMDSVVTFRITGRKGYCPTLAEYISDPENPEETPLRAGWYAQLSASGYLDQGPLNGPHRTECAALKALASDCDAQDDGEEEDLPLTVLLEQDPPEYSDCNEENGGDEIHYHGRNDIYDWVD